MPVDIGARMRRLSSASHHVALTDTCPTPDMHNFPLGTCIATKPHTIEPSALTQKKANTHSETTFIGPLLQSDAGNALP